MKWIIGIDEVGRGPLAGPVHVCAAAMPYDSYRKARWTGLNDSKVMTAAARERWKKEADRLKREGKIRFAVASRSAKAIDERGISACLASCIQSALLRLKLDPAHALVLLDGGLKAPARYRYQRTIIRGDGSERIISLASVIAKVTRDTLMRTLAKKHPAYRWEENKGYGTRAHRMAIKKSKLTAIHRKSFCSKVF